MFSCTALGLLQEVQMANVQYIEMLHAWHHDGVESWGGSWESRAQGEAMEELKAEIAQMANVESLVMSSSSSESDKIKVNAAIDLIKRSGSGAFDMATDEAEASSMSVKNRNNFVVFIKDCIIVRDSAHSKDKTDWKGVRSWKAWLTIRATVGIFLPSSA
jgi:hypothetical protein